MSRFQQAKDELVADQHQTDHAESWLERDEEVEVIWVDPDGKPHKAVGRYHGIRVPDGGGPSPLVLKDGDDEISIDLEYIAGMTKSEASPREV